MFGCKNGQKSEAQMTKSHNLVGNGFGFGFHIEKISNKF